MKVVWLSWKDRGNPLSGGAESVSGNIIDKMLLDGHEVKLITADYKNSIKNEKSDRFEIIRLGNRYTVYLKAAGFYKKHLTGWADLVIDEMNTIPFISARYSKTKNLMLCYQLAREVWLYQMIPPLSYIGYLMEPLMLRYVAKRYRHSITESLSTKIDMESHGFRDVSLFRVGMTLAPAKKLTKKKAATAILSLGSIRPMKRTLDAVKAFELARDINKSLELTVAGDNTGSYAKKVMAYIARSRHKKAISVIGRVTERERLALMRDAALILVTSIKEGWGLIVTEANSQGTPAIVYDVDGLRDSVIDTKTGILSKNSSTQAMANSIVHLLSDEITYESMRQAAWEWSKQFTHENSYEDFIKVVKKIR